MELEVMLLQTAEAMEEYLTEALGNNNALVNDLKLLSVWVKDVEPGRPGTLAMAIVDQAIKEYGFNCDKLAEDLVFELYSANLNDLREWVGCAFKSGELLMLDVILFTERVMY